MRLFEIFDELKEYSDYRSVKKTDWDGPYQLNKWLTDNGFKEIGSGIYSTVYQKPGAKFVVKVYQGGGSIPEREIAWYQYCFSNKQNSFLPKVGKIKQIDDWYLVFVEQLKPLTDENLKKAYNMSILPYLGMHMQDDEVMEKNRRRGRAL